jgi:hypothetical protein
MMSVIGPPFIGFPLFFMSLYGPQLLAKRFYSHFQRLVFGYVGLTIAVGIGSFLVVYLNPMGYGYAQAAQACIYAGKDQCTAIYQDIFSSGPSPLETTMQTWAVVVFFECVLRTVRKAILVQMDFAFMRNTSIAAFAFGFVPAIVVVKEVYPTDARAYLIAMYVPHVVMCIVFSARFCFNMRKMTLGQDGPWNTYAMRSSSLGSFTCPSTPISESGSASADAAGRAGAGAVGAHGSSDRFREASAASIEEGDNSRKVIWASEFDESIGFCGHIPGVGLLYWIWYAFIRPNVASTPERSDFEYVPCCCSGRCRRRRKKEVLLAKDSLCTLEEVAQ